MSPSDYNALSNHKIATQLLGEVETSRPHVIYGASAKVRTIQLHDFGENNDDSRDIRKQLRRGG